MANIKISELPAASAASTTQEFETNDSGTSKKVTGSQLKTFVKDGLVVADVTDLTATAAELNTLDGILVSTAELNSVYGITANVQSQLYEKAPTASPVFSGNMGLGVTPFSWGVDRTVFDLKNTAVYSSPSNFGGFANNAYYNGSGWVYKYSDFAQAYECGGGFHSWYTAPSGTAGNPVTWTKRLSINSSGAFGINNNYGTSGQVMTSAGSGAAPSWASLPSSATLLGTITTTSGASQTLSGLDLTNYKFLVAVLNSVSGGTTAHSITMESLVITATTSASNEAHRGVVVIELTTGAFSASCSKSATSPPVSNLGTTYAGDCNILNSSTSITFAPNTGVFDAGAIRIFGV